MRSNASLLMVIRPLHTSANRIIARLDFDGEIKSIKFKTIDIYSI